MSGKSNLNVNRFTMIQLHVVVLFAITFALRLTIFQYNAQQFVSDLDNAEYHQQQQQQPGQQQGNYQKIDASTISIIDDHADDNDSSMAQIDSAQFLFLAPLIHAAYSHYKEGSSNGGYGGSNGFSKMPSMHSNTLSSPASTINAATSATPLTSMQSPMQIQQPQQQQLQQHSNAVPIQQQQQYQQQPQQRPASSVLPGQFYSTLSIAPSLMDPDLESDAALQPKLDDAIITSIDSKVQKQRTSNCHPIDDQDQSVAPRQSIQICRPRRRSRLINKFKQLRNHFQRHRNRRRLMQNRKSHHKMKSAVAKPNRELSTSNVNGQVQANVDKVKIAN